MSYIIAGSICYSIIVLLFIYSTILLLKFFFCDRKRISQEPNNYIRQPIEYVLIGYSVSLIRVVGCTLGMLDIPDKKLDGSIPLVERAEDFQIPILAILPALIIELFAIFSVNWQLKIDSTYFIRTNWLGCKKAYNYDEVEFRWFKSGYRCYRNGRYLFTLSILQNNHNRILESQKEYLNSNKTP